MMALLQAEASDPLWWEVVKFILQLAAALLAGGGAGVWVSQRQAQKQSQRQAQGQQQIQELAQRLTQQVTVGSDEQGKVVQANCGCYPLGPSSSIDDPEKKVPVCLREGALTVVACTYFDPEGGTCESLANFRQDHRCSFTLRLPQPLRPPAEGE